MPFAVLGAVLGLRRPDDVPATIRRALAGDRRAARRLAERVAPVIRARVLRMTRGRRGPGGLDTDDLIHEVWCRLLDDDGRRLRGYDPERGKTFEGYVSMVAGQLVATMAEKHAAAKRRAPGGEGELTEAQHVADAIADPEQIAAGRDLHGALWRHLEGQLSERGQAVLALVYTDGLSVDEAADRMGVRKQVVYNWQHKIRGLTRAWMAAA